MKHINIETTRTATHLTVVAKIKEQCARKNKEIMVCHTEDIIQKLKEENIKVGSCIKESTLCNTRPQTCVGSWIFELPSRPPKSHRRKKSKKSNISLDKSRENVIIEEEETEDKTTGG
tara:strand:- start:497 stop:850 length:354 start_codon:yes stop_codon:yes gene_type:complete